jgi:hypothetical protein
MLFEQVLRYVYRLLLAGLLWWWARELNETMETVTQRGASLGLILAGTVLMLATLCLAYESLAQQIGNLAAGVLELVSGLALGLLILRKVRQAITDSDAPDYTEDYA